MVSLSERRRRQRISRIISGASESSAHRIHSIKGINGIHGVCGKTAPYTVVRETRFLCHNDAVLQANTSLVYSKFQRNLSKLLRRLSNSKTEVQAGTAIGPRERL